MSRRVWLITNVRPPFLQEWRHLQLAVTRTQRVHTLAHSSCGAGRPRAPRSAVPRFPALVILPPASRASLRQARQLPWPTDTCSPRAPSGQTHERTNATQKHSSAATSHELLCCLEVASRVLQWCHARSAHGGNSHCNESLYGSPLLRCHTALLLYWRFQGLSFHYISWTQIIFSGSMPTEMQTKTPTSPTF